MTLVFDKLKFSKRLEVESTFDRRQAEVLTEALHDAISEGIATRQDLSEATAALRQEIAAGNAQLRQEIAAGNAQLRQEIAETKSELRLEIAALRTVIREAEVAVMRWMVAVASLALAIVGAFRFFVH